MKKRDAQLLAALLNVIDEYPAYADDSGLSLRAVRACESIRKAARSLESAKGGCYCLDLVSSESRRRPAYWAARKEW